MKKIFGLFVVVVIFVSIMPIISHAQYGGGGEIIPVVSPGGGGSSGGRRHVPAPIQEFANRITGTSGQVLGASTGFQFGKNLSVGMSGDDVTELQNRLTLEGVYTGPITGYFGPLTMAGVKAFQSKYGIDQVGVVGPITMAKLNEGGAVLGAQTGPTTTIEQMKAVLAQLQAQVMALFTKIKSQSQ